ncbi:MAG: hypothetical protein R2722_13570 [Tessaracoccus sp.]
MQSREARRLVRWCHEHGDGRYTAELGARFAAAVVKPLTGEFSMQRYQSFGRLNRLADTYLLTGEVDLSVVSRTRGTKPMPQGSAVAGPAEELGAGSPRSAVLGGVLPPELGHDAGSWCSLRVAATGRWRRSQAPM